MAVRKKTKAGSKAKAPARAGRKPAAKKAAARKPSAKKTARKTAARKPAAKKTSARKTATTARKAAGKKGNVPYLNEIDAALLKLIKAGQADSRSATGTTNEHFDIVMRAIIEDQGNILEAFMETANLFTNLTPAERMRLIGAGVRNYGFIEKARDIARENPGFLPPNFDVKQFSDDLESFDLVRQVYLGSEKMQTMSSDKMLLMSSDLFRESLRIYNSLKEQAKGRVAGARDLFVALEMYFKRRRASERQPTEKEEMKKARGIIKGTVDGEMLLKNRKAKKSGGVHEVIEDFHEERINGKKTEEFSE